MAGESFSLTITRDKLTWIKATLLKDFYEITTKYGIEVSPQINGNRQDQVYQVMNAEFAFFGLDYPEKLHGRKQDWFWINEAMEVGRKHFDQLEMRSTKGGVIDYNPVTDEHWVYDLQKRPDTQVIVSTMLDNPFLPEAITNKILSYQPTEENIANGTADQYMWDVYGLGVKAKLQGAVFEHFEVIERIPEGSKLLGIGLDFGYSNHPAAAIEVYLYDQKLILNELFYATKLLNSDIMRKLENLNIKKDVPIYPDPAEPKSVAELGSNGWNVRDVAKGADSINFGINVLKSYKLCITSKSLNTERELRRYKWMQNKLGEVLPKPIDEWNHAIDAARYVAMETLGKPETKVDLVWL